ncbi:MAG: UDP-N-acetylmuramate dehydrogenase [Sebaldella sp.]|nr:UDP-N-acetylmuramate dehydrogenase [Sebaldella sp.]
MKILSNVEMKNYSNMKIGGRAKELIFIEKEDELTKVLQTRDKVFLLGNGTNTLINDRDLDISFISLKEFNKMEILEKNDDFDLVSIGAGTNLDDLIDFMDENNYAGLENIAGIPGSVGGLVNMNGGAYGTEIFDCIDKVIICDLDGNIKEYKKEELNYNYRTTDIKEHKWIVIKVLFKFHKGFDKECSEDKKNKREERHPLDLPNLGSTFKNPDQNFAAQLISDAGLKEFRVGNAMISPKHPNFIVNLGDAKFEDVMGVIAHVKKTIKEKNGIDLQTEIIIIK